MRKTGRKTVDHIDAELNEDSDQSRVQGRDTLQARLKGEMHAFISLDEKSPYLRQRRVVLLVASDQPGQLNKQKKTTGYGQNCDLPVDCETNSENSLLLSADPAQNFSSNPHFPAKELQCEHKPLRQVSDKYPQREQSSKIEAKVAKDRLRSISRPKQTLHCRGPVRYKGLPKHGLS